MLYFYLYIISRWIIVIPLYSLAIAYILIVILKKFDISICENYFFYCVWGIGIFIIVMFDRKKYTNIDKNKLIQSEEFKKDVGVILGAHSLLAITLLILKWQPVLSFFAFPIVVLIGALYFSGFYEAYNEMAKYQKEPYAHMKDKQKRFKKY